MHVYERHARNLARNDAILQLLKFEYEELVLICI